MKRQKIGPKGKNKEKKKTHTEKELWKTNTKNILDKQFEDTIIKILTGLKKKVDKLKTSTKI